MTQPTPDARIPVDAPVALAMLGLCSIWAFQQIAVKATLHDAAPVLQIGLRSVLAALCVAAYMRARGQAMHWRAHARAGVVVGVLFGLEFLLVSAALSRTSAAHTVVFLYTSPLWAALGLHLRLRDERMNAGQWAGVLLAFAGVAWAFMAGDARPGGTSWQGDLAALGAGLAWGLTTVSLRGSVLARAQAAETLMYQLLGASTLLLAVALLSGQTALRPTWALAASLLFQSVVVAFLTFLAWFALLRRYVAATLGVYTFFTPVLGVVFGAWLLGEALQAAFIQGALAVLLGVVAVSLGGRR